MERGNVRNSVCVVMLGTLVCTVEAKTRRAVPKHSYHHHHLHHQCLEIVPFSNLWCRISCMSCRRLSICTRGSAIRHHRYPN